MKNYKESLDFLFRQLPMFSRTGAPAYKPGLETSINLARFFDNPHQKIKLIHIGGTNGKGSTSHMIASVLQSQGYKVGLYTSPHLVDFRERMKINGKMIPECKVTEFVNAWQNSGYDGHPSFFELTMIMAFNWFAEEMVDYAVIEVGMGGRLDSTNIITPLLSVITNISHDHNQFLGNSLEEIATEKAGIIKHGIPVVIGETQAETENIFKNRAKEMKSSIIFADKEIADENLYDNNEEKGIKITESSNGWKCKYKNLHFNLPLGGDYQKKNVITVLATLNELRKLGIKIDDNSVVEGIEKVCVQTGLAGRWMILDTLPLTIADTGHNIAGITYNFNQLSNLMKERPGGKLRVIIGFVADKAIDKIVILLPKDAIYYVTNAQIPRALPSGQLMDMFEQSGLKGKKFSDVKEAFNKAKEEASNKDIIFIGGSTFIVADLLS